MNIIDRAEKDSILYYQGGGTDIVLSTEKQNLREFYNMDNSYIVLNALLMPGISNEKVRLIEEGKKTGISIFRYMDELVEIYCRLYSAMCKYTYLYDHEDKYHTYRTDRINTLEFLSLGQMPSFMSTQKCNDINEDFHDKDGILLLEVEAHGSIEHVDVNAVLKEESKYPHEQEILFAPFTVLDMEPLEMTDEEKHYKDIHDNPPEAKYLLHIRLSSIDSYWAGSDEELDELYQGVMEPVSINIAMQVWEAFMSGKKLEEDVVQRYVEWKKKIRIYLRMRFARIKYEVIHRQETDGECGAGESPDIDGGQSSDHNQDNSHIQGFWKRWNKLNQDITNYYNYTNEKRKKYKRYVQIVNGIVSVLGSLTALFIALSFADSLKVIMKTASLLSSAVSAVVPMIAKGFAWSEKLQQRTTTYMNLDTLMRDMRYGESLDENSLDGYVERYKTIIDLDNKMGLENALTMGNYSEKIAKKAENQ